MYEEGAKPFTMMFKQALGVCSAIILAYSVTAAGAGPVADAVNDYQRRVREKNEAVVKRGVPPFARTKKLADRGDAIGQTALGELYLRGDGVPQSYKKAVEWFRKAASQGHNEAQMYLGIMYDNGGHGVPQDYAEALKWFAAAAAQDNSEAQARLASMYYRGHGTSPDYVRAHMWADLAAVMATQLQSLQSPLETKSQRI